MPYIVMKRNDIDDGLLQQLDLRPNVSQRRNIDPPGQTQYRRDILNGTTTLTADVFDTAASGLTPWLLANVSSGSGGAGAGSITTVVQASLLDGETVVISDGTTSLTFVIVVTAGYAVAPPNVMVDCSAAVTATNVRDAFILAINAVSNFDILAAAGGAATVTLSNTNENITAASRNVAITETVAFAGVSATGTYTEVNAPLSQPGYVAATGRFEFAAAPITGVGVDTCDVCGNVLTIANGPRTPGNDDMDGTLGNVGALAAEMVAAITDPTNSFAAVCTAADIGAVVTVTSVVMGTPGNALTIAVTLTAPGEILVSGATLAGGLDADLITIAGTPLTSANGARTPGNDDFDGSLLTPTLIAADMVAAINDVANSFVGSVVASNLLGVVTITAATAGVAGNAITTTVTVTNPADLTVQQATLAGGIDGFATVGMVGATNSDALTVAEATQDATDILGILNYGAAAAAGALTLAAINGALTTGTITQAQLPEVLEILAGRTYTVPAGTIIEAAAAFIPVGASTMFTTDTRHTQMTGALRISMGEGRLAQATAATFSYGGTAGAAVAVYNDDGTLFTVPS